MSIRLRVGQTAQLPSGNIVRVLRIDGESVVCVYLSGRLRGEVDFNRRWLQRFALGL